MVRNRRSHRHPAAAMLLAAAFAFLTGCAPSRTDGPADARSPSGARQPTTAPVTLADDNRVFPLAKAMSIPTTTYTADELVRQWPAFRHEPFETSGFNFFVLPFGWAAKPPAAEASNNYAVSFLLSSALDWTPGSYCSRHAYFVFKRARRYVGRLVGRPDPAMVAWALKDWGATHAVGGMLTRTNAGLSGTLNVYDRAGKIVMTKAFAKPRSASVLVGDMAAAVMTHVGHKPRPALLKHMRAERYKDPQSLIDLGRAALAKERSDEEFGLYRKILKRDGDFAEVRYWFANQKWWLDRDGKDCELNKARSLNSYVTLAPLKDFHPGACPDKELAKKYDLWIKQAEDLAGPDMPDLLTMALDRAIGAGKLTPELVARATAVAAKFSNEYWLMNNLAQAYHRLHDREMAASIYLAGWRSRYLTGMGGQYRAMCGVAVEVLCLGHLAPAVSVARQIIRAERREGRTSNLVWPEGLLGGALGDMGHFAKGVEAYEAALAHADAGDAGRNRDAAYAALLAAISGDIETLERLARDHAKEIAASGMGFIIAGYRDALAGKPVDSEAIMKTADAQKDGRVGSRALLLAAQLSLLAGRQDYRDRIGEGLCGYPGWRPWRVMYDAYDRAAPRADSGAFYEAAEWLFPHDPWAVRSAADFRARMPKPAVLSADDLIERLADYPPDDPWPVRRNDRRQAAGKLLRSLPPLAPDAAIRRCLAAKKFPQAEKLALRYRRIATDANFHSLIEHCNHILHRVRQARDAAKQPAKERQ